MKKKLVFKKWVEELLAIITFLTAIVASADCEDIALFNLKMAICLAIMVINAILIYKYGRENI